MLDHNSNNLLLSTMVNESSQEDAAIVCIKCVFACTQAHTYLSVDSHRLAQFLCFVQSPRLRAGQEIYVLCRPDTVLPASSPAH